LDDELLLFDELLLEEDDGGTKHPTQLINALQEPLPTSVALGGRHPANTKHLSLNESVSFVAFSRNERLTFKYPTNESPLLNQVISSTSSMPLKS
jgi:hypothetical protein